MHSKSTLYSESIKNSLDAYVHALLLYNSARWINAARRGEALRRVRRPNSIAAREPKGEVEGRAVLLRDHLPGEIYYYYL